MRKAKIYLELPPDLSGGQYKIQQLALAKILIFLEIIYPNFRKH